ncbi:MAG: hypothetical protein PHF94_00845 [Methanothrix sp.]|nr:hypothetical protein [Methanothrix sp.]
MSKNPEFAKYASDLARHQDAIRSSNEDLIKLSQRFGRMMPKLSKLDSSAILTWLGLYNKIKDRARKTDDEIATLVNSDQAAANPMLQLQMNYYYSQRQRLCFKMEVMDDILSGMMEDLLENGSFEEAQKQEMKTALDATMEKSMIGLEMSAVSA